MPNPSTNPTTNFDALPLKDLENAAAKAQEALGLKYLPTVVRNEASAFSFLTETALSRTATASPKSESMEFIGCRIADIGYRISDGFGHLIADI